VLFSYSLRYRAVLKRVQTPRGVWDTTWCDVIKWKLSSVIDARKRRLRLTRNFGSVSRSHLLQFPLFPMGLLRVCCIGRVSDFSGAVYRAETDQQLPQHDAALQRVPSRYSVRQRSASSDSNFGSPLGGAGVNTAYPTALPRGATRPRAYSVIRGSAMNACCCVTDDGLLQGTGPLRKNSDVFMFDDLDSIASTLAFELFECTLMVNCCWFELGYECS
jgi:hypothetical protein